MYTGIIYIYTADAYKQYDTRCFFERILQDSMDKTEGDDSSRVVPCKDWKKGGISRIMYTHSSCPGLTCSLTCTSLGPYIMVHGMSLYTCWFYVLWLIIFGSYNIWKLWSPNGCLMCWTSGLSLAGVIVLCSWARQFTLTVTEANYQKCVSLGGKAAMGKHTSRGRSTDF